VVQIKASALAVVCARPQFPKRNANPGCNNPGQAKNKVLFLGTSSFRARKKRKQLLADNCKKKSEKGGTKKSSHLMRTVQSPQTSAAERPVIRLKRIFSPIGRGKIVARIRN